MKALILTDDNGLEYEDHQWWVSHVFLVPDGFDEGADWRAFIKGLGQEGLIRVTKEGDPYQSDVNKAVSLYPADLKLRGFEEIPFVGAPRDC